MATDSERPVMRLWPGYWRARQWRARRARLEVGMQARKAWGAMFLLATLGALALVWRGRGSGETPPHVSADWRSALSSWRHPDALPNLPFVDGHGQPFSLDELRDSWVLVGFVFTRCGNPEACPLTMQQMRSVQAAWTSSDPPLELLAVTIDPTYDTPERLEAYAHTFGRASGLPRWRMATGDEEMIASLLPQLFNILVLPEGETLTHTVKLALLRPGLVLEDEWEGAVPVSEILKRIRSEE